MSYNIKFSKKSNNICTTTFSNKFYNLIKKYIRFVWQDLFPINPFWLALIIFPFFNFLLI